VQLQGRDAERTPTVTRESGAGPVVTCEYGIRCVSGLQPDRQNVFKAGRSPVER
jgi:hypothetical protein